MAMTSMEGVDEDLYKDETPSKAPESVDEQEKMNPTSLVDMKVLTGKHGPPKEGDEVVVKVVAVHGDQAEVEYAPEKPGEDAKETQIGGDEDVESLNKTY